MKKVTLWERQEPQTKEWFYNHLVAGWDKEDNPNPGTERQAKYWRDGVWRKWWCWETSRGKVIKTL